MTNWLNWEIFSLSPLETIIKRQSDFLSSSFSHTSNTRCILLSPQEKGHVHQEHWLQQLQQSPLKHCNSQIGHTHQEHWSQQSPLEQTNYPCCNLSRVMYASSFCPLSIE